MKARKLGQVLLTAAAILFGLIGVIQIVRGDFLGGGWMLLAALCTVGILFS